MCRALRSPRASLIGVPNALLGVILYVVVAIGLLAHWPAWLLFVMMLPAIAMSIVLGYSLISRSLQCRILLDRSHRERDPVCDAGRRRSLNSHLRWKLHGWEGGSYDALCHGIS